MSKPAGPWLLAISLAAFVWGVSELFHDRLDSGDVYPPYSTLRSDPLGCRALYAALERYPDLRVARAYSRADFRAAPGAAYFLLGLDAESILYLGDELKELDSLARKGQRVVIGFAPVDLDSDRGYELRHSGLWPVEPKDTAEARGDSSLAKGDAAKAGRDTSAAKRDASADSSRSRPGLFRWREIADGRNVLRAWGCRLVLDTALKAKRGRAEAEGNLHDTLSWYGALRFDSLQTPWKALYRRAGEAVAVERPLGAGSLALTADSRFASNEAQLEQRPGALTAKLAGGAHRLYFDERHLGVRRDDALVNLLHRYHLDALLPGLLLLLLMYVWKSRSELLPEPVDPQNVRAQDPRSALAALLRRNLSPEKALEACMQLWKEAHGNRGAAGTSGTEAGGDRQAEGSPASRKAGEGKDETSKHGENLAAGYARLQSQLHEAKGRNFQ